MKQFDLYVRKIYSTVSLHLCIANHQALLSRYFNVWQFTDLLLQNVKQEFSAMLDEDRAIARAFLQAASDMADSVTRAVASLVSIRETLWLQPPGLSAEVQ